jgi:hypothetical protein
MKRLGTPINPATLQQAPPQVPQVQAPPVQAPAMPASPYAAPPSVTTVGPPPSPDAMVGQQYRVQIPASPVPNMEQQIRQAIDTPPPVPMPVPAPLPQPEPVSQQTLNTPVTDFSRQQAVPLPTEHTEWVKNAPVNQPTYQPKSLLHSIDMGSNPVNVFVSIPGGEDVEGEITKVELKTSRNDNPMLALQLRASWPKQYAGALIYDNVVLTAEAAWKYKSICAACVDENGNRLLSDDNRFFTGNSEQDFLGNIVAFKSDEPSLSAAGNPVNKVKGGYNIATRTEVEEPSGNGTQITSPNLAGVPPIPTF